MSTSFRMLQLLSLLQTHRYWSGADLAHRLEVSARTLRRDVDRLRELGYPVEAGRGVGGGYQLAAGATLPPLVLDDEEAVAIAVGLHTGAQGPVAGIEAPSVRALTKVIQVMPPRLRERVDALRAMTVPAVWADAIPAGDVGSAVLTLIAQACRDAERLRFTYARVDGQPSERYVEPHRLVSLGRHWYLVAYDLVRHDWRSFRLDRLANAQRTGGRFRPRDLPGGDAADFVRTGIENVPRRYQVEVLIRAPAAAVRTEVGRWAAVEEISDQESLLRADVDALEWIALFLGAVGADFEVRSPPELTSYLREWGERFTRATNI
ncbi:YafY family protein [Pseudarthrobacter sp. SSS035]|uniref:helix-turn-helix transcriptional regulator n=1 Tax=Pseudarthrobacter sp. SSS035 TaxID=2931399 RepID=UPI00200E94E8|nr:YafY family protein [Pseudarthrobacter sp. SSS035]